MTPTLSVTQDGLITADAVDLIPNSFNNAQLFVRKTGSTDPVQIVWGADFRTPNPFPTKVQIPNLEPNISYDVSFGGVLAWGETTLGGSSWMIGVTFTAGASASGQAVNLLAQQAAKHGKKK